MLQLFNNPTSADFTNQIFGRALTCQQNNLMKNLFFIFCKNFLLNLCLVVKSFSLSLILDYRQDLNNGPLLNGRDGKGKGWLNW